MSNVNLHILHTCKQEEEIKNIIFLSGIMAYLYKPTYSHISDI